MTEITIKEQNIEKTTEPETEGRAVVAYKITGLKESTSASSDWAVASRAFEKLKSAGIDRKVIRDVLEGLGCQVESFEDILPIKKDPNIEGELGKTEGVLIDYQWKSYDPAVLLNDPQALQNFERLTVSKSLSLRDGVNGLVVLRGISRVESLLKELPEVLEINVLVKDKPSVLQDNSQDLLE